MLAEEECEGFFSCLSVALSLLIGESNGWLDSFLYYLIPLGHRSPIVGLPSLAASSVEKKGIKGLFLVEGQKVKFRSK